ncbi:hypothetical protein R70006_04987 [Paraburkholderia domus]|uniref:hypothetical protein n=1 Tax=Paraburkholderia domus TaxID=2793075 RepID=UPI001912C82E|nr:hypothetical protein [Paraburkholderia domus]MBK5051776.1 hypothetical protein [Burkholderia sp. R-70006]CAE6794088.1 hypothetical protein R70006_04987 [Paraburkholderia domus]
MSEKKPLSRRQLRNIQLARGIPAEELQHRTGMPRASYDALFGATSGEDGKDAAKLISQSTFDRLVSLLGIDADFVSLRKTGVIEWRADLTGKETAEPWADAMKSLIDELFSADLMLVEVSTDPSRGRLTRNVVAERMVLLHDRDNSYRVAIVGAAEDLVPLLENSFGIACERRITISANEFHDAREMIRHEVFKPVQFDAFSGALAPKYSWRDVQAAAREFGFLPDDLIEMMHTKAKERSERLRAEGAPDEVATIGMVDGNEYAVRSLKLVQA